MSEAELKEKFKYMCEALGGRLKQSEVKALGITELSCLLDKPRMVHVDVKDDELTIFVEPPIFYGKWSAGFSFPLPKITTIGSALIKKGSEISTNVEASAITLHKDGSVSIEGTIPSAKKYYEWLKELEKKVFE